MAVKKLDIRIFLVLVVVSAFVVATLPLSAIKLSTMGTGQFFFETITPFPYWIGIFAILAVIFYIIPYLNEDKYIPIFVFASIALITLIRAVFPLIFTNLIIYEPDASNYVSVVSMLIQNPDFGHSGNYQHDYPLSFFIGFIFGKLGVPIEAFFRFAPLFIYAINLILFYFIVNLVTSKPKIAAFSVFLFTISPLNYWFAVHFCPDLVGSLFYLISLYLVIRLVKTEAVKISTVMPVLVSVFLLILAHHLSTLYFIVTIFGLAFVAWYFKTPYSKKALLFLIVGIYTYTLWFTYGTLMYPEFFNVYSYFGGGGGSAIALSMQANLFENFTFVIYPLFILTLVVLYFKRYVGFRRILGILRRPRRLIHPNMFKMELDSSLQYSIGFCLVIVLFFGAFVIPNIFPPRVLEVIMIGLCPLAATYFSTLALETPSKKKRILLFVIVLIIIILSSHRYYSQIQGRVIGR